MTGLYTATATATNGRNGHVETDDGLLKLDLSVPKPMGGEGKAGATNPEQLFACGYSACFGGALDFVAGQKQVKLSPATVTAAVTFNKDDSGFFLSVKLTVAAPGMDKAVLTDLVHAAHGVCPYSKATRGNITVDLVVA
jgi:osmotically inducible protein OsmC